MPRRGADLGRSSWDKLQRCEKYLNKISTNYDPETCLKMMRSVCEVRNAALQAPEKALATYHIGDAYFIRDVRYDISQFMRFIKRKLNGDLSTDYAGYELYCHQQKTYFKQLKKNEEK